MTAPLGQQPEGASQSGWMDGPLPGLKAARHLKPAGPSESRVRRADRTISGPTWRFAGRSIHWLFEIPVRATTLRGTPIAITSTRSMSVAEVPDEELAEGTRRRRVDGDRSFHTPRRSRCCSRRRALPFVLPRAERRDVGERLAALCPR